MVEMPPRPLQPWGNRKGHNRGQGTILIPRGTDPGIMNVTKNRRPNLKPIRPEKRRAHSGAQKQGIPERQQTLQALISPKDFQSKACP